MAYLEEYQIFLMVMGGIGLTCCCCVTCAHAAKLRAARKGKKKVAPLELLTDLPGAAADLTNKVVPLGQLGRMMSKPLAGIFGGVNAVGGATVAVGRVATIDAVGGVVGGGVDDERSAACAKLDKEATAAIPEQLDKYKKLLKCVALFKEMGDQEVEAAAQEMHIRHFSAGEVIYDEGSLGNEAWVLEEGKCFASKQVWSAAYANVKEWKELRTYKPGEFGSFFGERALVRSEPRNLRITCRTDVKVCRIDASTYVTCARIREAKEDLIRGIELFAQMTDEQMGKLAQVMVRQAYADGETLLAAGAPADTIYLVASGETSAPADGDGKPAKILGEACLSAGGDGAGASVGATITAKGEVTVYAITKADFEAKLGQLPTLQAEQYAADPRKLLSDFFYPGDANGPLGVAAANGGTPQSASPTSWFAVYRPCSRDSIAKMLGTVAVGKGLNIKGKSAKKNRLSGFVPFMQISDNAHKRFVEPSPKDARTHVYFRNVMARQTAESHLIEVMRNNHELQIDDPTIHYISDYEPKTFGLDVPEPVLRQAYIIEHDLTPIIGWETGRASEPAFMDMNLHSVRDGAARKTNPAVVLYQFDLSDPLNPHGLLIAYAEAEVKPVCSDFDTFTVGSKGMAYEPTPENQLELVTWSLDHTTALLTKPSPKGWMSRWLDVLKAEAAKGFHPALPKYGFGDPTSYGMIDKVVGATASCGAVRHGAECFNFYFPQDLDDQFLIVWDGYQNPPWRSVGEPELRQFLIDRCKDGYSFPINPVWPVRDPGWDAVLEALEGHTEGKKNLAAWFPPESKVLERIRTLHREHPNGFKPTEPPPGAAAPAAGKKQGKHIKSHFGAALLALNLHDVDTREMADYTLAEVRGEVKMRWRRVRNAFIVESRLRRRVRKDAVESTPLASEGGDLAGPPAGLPPPKRALPPIGSSS